MSETFDLIIVGAIRGACGMSPPPQVRDAVGAARQHEYSDTHDRGEDIRSDSEWGLSIARLPRLLGLVQDLGTSKRGTDI